MASRSATSSVTAPIAVSAAMRSCATRPSDAVVKSLIPITTPPSRRLFPRQQSPAPRSLFRLDRVAAERPDGWDRSAVVRARLPRAGDRVPEVVDEQGGGCAEHDARELELPPAHGEVRDRDDERD